MSPRKKKNIVSQGPKHSVKDTLEKRVMSTRSSSAKKTRVSPSKGVDASPAKSRCFGSPKTQRSLLKTPVKVTCNVKKNLTNSPRRPLDETASTHVMATRRSPLKVSQCSLFDEKEKSPRKSPLRNVYNSSVKTVPSPSGTTRRRIIPSPEKSPKSSRCKQSNNSTSSPLSKTDCRSGDNTDNVPSHSSHVSLTPSICPSPCEEKDGKKGEPPNDMRLKKTMTGQKNDPQLPTDPELSGRFLRRKWFSLKSRGGFTCLRSAILSPEEIAKEVMQHTMVYSPKEDDANFFSTKLMVRLSSRLPPTRARPSCEELVDLINSKHKQGNHVTLQPPTGEGTAIRVKLERRSFSDTISHVTNLSSKLDGDNHIETESVSRKTRGSPQARNEISKMREREIALRQLKNMRYWRGGQYRY